MAPKDVDSWTDRDSVLYATCEIALSAMRGRLHDRPMLAHDFVLQFSPHERLLASGQYDLHWWGSAGDGSYQSRTTIVGGGGGLGIGLLGATALASAAGNASRRSQAAMAAMDAWRPVDVGVVHITDFGFYVHGSAGFRAFAWSHIVQGDVTHETVFQFSAQTTQGTQQFRIPSDWSELVFFLWATTMDPSHPRLVGKAWLDPAFFDKCRRHGYGAPALGS